jgi:glycosyltransferase involved in cell wall biosynthesis
MHDIDRLLGDAAIATAMQDADALLFPSRSEGFGLVAAEAMACGVPVVATRNSSLSEVIEDGVSGILCAQDDVPAFCNAAQTLARREDRAYMGKAARLRATTMFKAEETVSAYSAAYRAITKGDSSHTKRKAVI